LFFIRLKSCPREVEKIYSFINKKKLAPDRQLVMSDTSSDSSLPSIGKSLRRAEGRREGTSILVPVLIIFGIALVIFLIMKYWHKGCMGGDSNNNNNVTESMAQPTPAPPANDGQVKQFKSASEFIELTKKGPIAVVFVADGCGWCTKLKPEHAKATQMTKVPIYMFNASIPGAQDVLTKLGISGFPTIMILGGGMKPIQFQMERTAEKLAAWVNQHIPK
jgi:hypothetical protein